MEGPPPKRRGVDALSTGKEITAFLLVKITNSKWVSSRDDSILLMYGYDWLCFYRQETVVQRLGRNPCPLTYPGVWFWGTHLQGLYKAARAVHVSLSRSMSSYILLWLTQPMSFHIHVIWCSWKSFLKSGFLFLRHLFFPRTLQQ